jgi:hypothetical protein
MRLPTCPKQPTCDAADSANDGQPSQPHLKGFYRHQFSHRFPLLFHHAFLPPSPPLTNKNVTASNRADKNRRRARMHSVPMYGTALRRAGKKSAWCQTMPYM